MEHHSTIFSSECETLSRVCYPGWKLNTSKYSALSLSQPRERKTQDVTLKLFGNQNILLRCKFHLCAKSKIDVWMFRCLVQDFPTRVFKQMTPGIRAYFECVFQKTYICSLHALSAFKSVVTKMCIRTCPLLNPYFQRSAFAHFECAFLKMCICTHCQLSLKILSDAFKLISLHLLHYCWGIRGSPFLEYFEEHSLTGFLKPITSHFIFWLVFKDLIAFGTW